MQNFPFWQKWLQYFNLALVFFSIAIAFAGDSFLFVLHNAGSEAVFFPKTGFTPEALQFKKLMFAIIGGTLAGNHLLLYFVAKYPFAERKKWAWQAIAASLLLWFIIDSGMSLYLGAGYNVILINIPALLGIGLPLLMTRKEFA